jgi:hypothetical protein
MSASANTTHACLCPPCNQCVVWHALLQYATCLQSAQTQSFPMADSGNRFLQLPQLPAPHTCSCPPSYQCMHWQNKPQYHTCLHRLHLPMRGCLPPPAVRETATLSQLAHWCGNENSYSLSLPVRAEALLCAGSVDNGVVVGGCGGLVVGEGIDSRGAKPLPIDCLIIISGFVVQCAPFSNKCNGFKKLVRVVALVVLDQPHLVQRL